MSNEPVHITDAEYEQKVLQSNIPVIVDFWAPWCGPCKMMAPAYEKAATVLEPHVRLAKVNTEEEQALAAKFGIASIPTLVIFRGGREVARQPGAMGIQDIERWIRGHLAHVR